MSFIKPKTIIIDGVDVSNKVTSVVVRNSAHEACIVELHYLADNVEVYEDIIRITTFQKK